MNTDTERLFVQLEARVSDFDKRMKQAERRGTRTYGTLERGSRTATRRMETDMTRATTRINGALAATTAQVGRFGAAFVGGLAGGAIAATLAGITANLGRTVRGIAELGDQAKRSGVGLKEFQQWKFVAEQNRIGIDSMVDGLKELNLRADEFVVTGGGPAAEAFDRLGFSAADLSQRLKEPSELMLEIVDRLGKVDKAAQIRISDEIFGGSAGERFVELLDQGEAGLRRTVERANEVGAVLDSELIEKAQELDRRFGELQARMSSFFKRLAVEAADAGVKIATLREDLDEMFRTYEQARGLLGGGVVEALEADSEAAGANAEAIGLIRRAYEELAEEGSALAPILEQASIQLRALGEADAADVLADTAGAMRDLASDMRDGTVDAETFEARMDELTTAASGAFAELSAVDQVEFSGAIGAVDGLVRKLGEAVEFARALRAALPGASPDGLATPMVYSGRGGDPRTMGEAERTATGTATGNAPATSPRPDARPIDIDFGYAPPEADTGRGGSGGAAEKLSAFQDAIAETRADIVQLELEAVELLAVAQSGREVGDALEYARRRAELLYAAQKDGREITPELRQEIDGLALAYTMAGQAAEDAAARLEAMEDRAERGAEAMANLFQGILTGSTSAKEALAGLLQQIAKVQFQKALAGLAAGGGDGGFISAIGGLLGFAGGGYTGSGATYEPAGVVHRGEYVFSKKSVEAIGVGQLQALHRAASRGYAAGGEVVAATQPAPQASAAAPDQGAGIGQPAHATRIVNAFDGTSFLEEALKTRKGEQVLLNFVSANQSAFKSAIGG